MSRIEKGPFAVFLRRHSQDGGQGSGPNERKKSDGKNRAQPSEKG